MCLTYSNKVLHATEMWQYTVWPWPKSQGQIWNYQLIPQMWFPIDVQYTCISYVYLTPITCYMLAKCNSTVYDLHLGVKVKFNITNGFLRYSLLLMFHTFYMSHSNKVLQAADAVFNVFTDVTYLTLIWPFRGHVIYPNMYTDESQGTRILQYTQETDNKQ